MTVRLALRRRAAAAIAGQGVLLGATHALAVGADRETLGENAMILPLTGLFIGAVLGAYRARRHGGGAADMAQWGAAHALALGIVGLFVLLLLSRVGA
ncbi:hypothetical protein [uncultured Limimaricola sp.]|uniref:hypothetical protein n=1 Tax=uncultured Limimaricola sp. TaxID=2211667 RepID=UPI0030FA4C4A